MWHILVGNMLWLNLVGHTCCALGDEAKVLFHLHLEPASSVDATPRFLNAVWRHTTEGIPCVCFVLVNPCLSQ